MTKTLITNVVELISELTPLAGLDVMLDTETDDCYIESVEARDGVVFIRALRSKPE